MTDKTTKFIKSFKPTVFKSITGERLRRAFQFFNNVDDLFEVQNFKSLIKVLKETVSEFRIEIAISNSNRLKVVDKLESLKMQSDEISSPMQYGYLKEKMIPVLLAELSLAIGSNPEYDIPKFAEPLMKAFNNPEIIELSTGNSVEYGNKKIKRTSGPRVYLHPELVAGTLDDYASAVTATRAALSYGNKLDPKRATAAWYHGLYVPARLGGTWMVTAKGKDVVSKTTKMTPKRLEDRSSFYWDIVNRRLSEMKDGRVGYWYLLNYGTVPVAKMKHQGSTISNVSTSSKMTSDKGGTGKPSAAPTFFIEKAEKRLTKILTDEIQSKMEAAEPAATEVVTTVKNIGAPQYDIDEKGNKTIRTSSIGTANAVKQVNIGLDVAIKQLTYQLKVYDSRSKIYTEVVDQVSRIITLLEDTVIQLKASDEVAKRTLDAIQKPELFSALPAKSRGILNEIQDMKPLSAKERGYLGNAISLLEKISRRVYEQRRVSEMMSKETAEERYKRLRADPKATLQDKATAFRAYTSEQEMLSGKRLAESAVDRLLQEMFTERKAKATQYRNQMPALMNKVENLAMTILAKRPDVINLLAGMSQKKFFEAMDRIRVLAAAIGSGERTPSRLYIGSQNGVKLTIRTRDLIEDIMSDGSVELFFHEDMNMLFDLLALLADRARKPLKPKGTKEYAYTF